MLHTIAFRDGAVVTATETAIAALAPDTAQIMDGLGPCILRQVGVGPESANATYIRLASTRFPRADLQMVVPWPPRINLYQPCEINDTILLYGYQDSGGNQDLAAFLTFQYGAARPAQPQYRAMPVLYDTTGTAADGVWTATANIFDGMQLNANSTYDILGFYGYSATNNGFRFSASGSFNGLKPGSHGYTDVGVGGATQIVSTYISFAAMGDVPSFKGNQVINSEILAGAAETGNMSIILGER